MCAPDVLSPVLFSILANIYMKAFRYFDETFVIWHHKYNNIQGFLDHILKKRAIWLSKCQEVTIGNCHVSLQTKVVYLVFLFSLKLFNFQFYVFFRCKICPILLLQRIISFLFSVALVPK